MEANKAAGSPVEETSQLRNIKDYFRSQFLKYFEGIGSQKWLIIEPSLYQVV